MSITLGSLFDGIGGFPLVAERVGITPLWASEIEPFPIEVTKIRFPQMLHVGDITKLNGAELPVVDIITGGSPCQDLSIAGNRAGLQGERSGLFMEQCRIVKEMRYKDAKRGVSADLIRPRYMCWENVPGAFSSADGEDFRVVLEEIVRITDSSCDVPRPNFGKWQSAGAILLGERFSLAWRVLDAQYWGVAQRRRRIFLVADFGGSTAPQILFEQDRLFGNYPQSRETWQGIATNAQTGVNDAIGFDGYNGDITGNKSATLGVNCGISTGRNGIVNLPTVCLNDQGGNRMDITHDVTTTLRANMGGHQPLVMATQQGGAEIAVDLCPTITSAAGTSGNNQPVVFDNHPKDGRYNGPLNVAPTMAARYGTGGNNVPLVAQVLFEGHGKDSRYNGPLDIAPTIASAYGEGGGNIPLAMHGAHAFSLDSLQSNSMKSSNPHSSCRETHLARTIDTSFPDPSKNQGGIAIVQESYCIAGNTIDRQDHNGGNGCGFQPDIAYTLNCTDKHAVMDATVFGQHQFGNYKEGCGTLRAEGGDNGGGSENLVAIGTNLVRRLTPLECERLQGFPDGWTNIPKGSDSARYKALGNSVAIPCVEFVLRGIAYFLRQEETECTSTPTT